MPAAHSQTPARLRFAALLIFVLGLLVAAWIYVSATRAQRHADSAADPAFVNLDDSTRREMQQVERLGGKATVMTVQFNQWLGSLWHGERLAYTLAILSIVVALGCRSIADLIDDEPAAPTNDEDAAR